MRPIVANKGGQGTYPYDLASPLTDRWTFAKGNATAATTLYGRKDPRITQCLDTWLWIAKYKNKQIKKRPGDYDERVTITKAVEGRIGDIYRSAGHPLITQIGTFCSYCEMYLPDALQVEHVAPKAQYPRFSLAWENFNLCCGPCNGKAAKSDRPTRDTVVATWMGGVQPAQEMDYYDEIRNQYLWPDFYLDGFTGLKPRLEYFSASTNQWKSVPAPRSVTLDMTWVSTDIQTRTVTANIWVSSTTKANRSVRVMLDPTFPQSTRIIDLCKLNSPGGTTGTISDRRMVQRTVAWFKILEFLNAAQWVQPPGFNVWWNSLLSTSVTMGFYSVWVQILNLTQMTDPNTGTLLVTRFVTDSNVPAYYPGTNTTQVPGP